MDSLGTNMGHRSNPVPRCKTQSLSGARDPRAPGYHAFKLCRRPAASCGAAPLLGHGSKALNYCIGLKH